MNDIKEKDLIISKVGHITYICLINEINNYYYNSLIYASLKNNYKITITELYHFTLDSKLYLNAEVLKNNASEEDLKEFINEYNSNLIFQ